MAVAKTSCLLIISAVLLSFLSSCEGLRIATIGDYGWAGSAEAGVASMVSSWQVDDVLALGDNNYVSEQLHLPQQKSQEACNKQALTLGRPLCCDPHLLAPHRTMARPPL